MISETALGLNPINVTLYADEIRTIKNNLNEKWMYLGLLAIEDSKRADILEVLNLDRESASYFNPIHFSNISTFHKYSLASKWLDRVAFDRWKHPVPPHNSKGIRFYVLGLCMSRISLESFGDYRRTRIDTIYNRFFRTLITYALLSFFGDYPTVNISTVYHHISHLNNHERFNWHAILKAQEANGKFQFTDRRIRFLDSDHRITGSNSEHSQLIQLIDVILGATLHSLDHTSMNRWKIKAAQHFRPVVASITNKSRSNDRTRFSIFQRGLIRFFPSNKLNPTQINDPMERASSGFYSNRKLLLPPGDGDYEQLELMDM